MSTTQQSLAEFVRYSMRAAAAACDGSYPTKSAVDHFTLLLDGLRRSESINVYELVSDAIKSITVDPPYTHYFEGPRHLEYLILSAAKHGMSLLNEVIAPDQNAGQRRRRKEEEFFSTIKRRTGKGTASPRSTDCRSSEHCGFRVTGVCRPCAGAP